MSGAHRAEPPRPPRRRPLPALVLAAAVLLGATGGLGTLAYWNDVETVSGGTVKAGSLDLTVEDGNGATVGQWDQLKLTSMAPGESVAATLTIRNIGTTPFSVQVVATGSGALTSAVDVALAAGVSPVTVTTTYPRTQTCAGAKDWALSGSPSWSVPGTIPAGSSLQLCVRMLLRSTAGNDSQNQSVTPTFTLTATQVQP